MSSAHLLGAGTNFSVIKSAKQGFAGRFESEMGTSISVDWMLAITPARPSMQTILIISESAGGTCECMSKRKIENFK